MALNRAVAVAEVDGPEVALALVEPLAMSSYHAWHATRADLLRRLERSDDARSAYDEAIRLAGNEEEREFLTRRRDAPLASSVLDGLGHGDAGRQHLLAELRSRSGSSWSVQSALFIIRTTTQSRARSLVEPAVRRRGSGTAAGRRHATSSSSSSTRFHSIGASS